MPVARKFQLYLLKGHGRASETVECLDAIERATGSCEAFERVFGILLVDRGTEFDDWAGMEGSCLEPGRRRCRVFYCDATESNQKSACERNHEQLRRILPKGRTHMDELSAGDVALVCSHVNSYPLTSLGGGARSTRSAGCSPTTCWTCSASAASSRETSSCGRASCRTPWTGDASPLGST